MNRTVSFIRSSLGSKYLMAISGFIGYGFLIVHIAGNLLLFAGQDALNAYGAGLKELPLQGAMIGRIVLVIAILVHIATALHLVRTNRQARPVAYFKKATRKASWASRHMALTGSVLLFYIIFHLAHFTWKLVAYDGPYVDAAGRDDIYTMVVQSFQQPLIALFYVAGMILVGVHISHGSKSMFQSLGVNHPYYNQAIETVPPLVGWLVALAGISMPLAVLFGFVQ